MTDNETAVSCIRRQGSLKSALLMSLTTKLFNFCLQHSITLVPKHLSGRLNVLADQDSRRTPISTEWSLDPTIFKWICSLQGPFQVDLFATRYNNKLSKFISPCPDPLASGINALSSLEHLGFHLPFPPNSHSPRSSFSADQLQREGSSDSSLVRRVELVSNPPRQGAGSSTSSFIPLPLSGHNRGQGIPPKPWSFSTSRVVTIRRALRSKGFSENVISITLIWLKDSPTSLYQGIWRKFMN